MVEEGLDCTKGVGFTIIDKDGEHIAADKCGLQGLKGSGLVAEEERERQQGKELEDKERLIQGLKMKYREARRVANYGSSALQALEIKNGELTAKQPSLSENMAEMKMMLVASVSKIDALSVSLEAVKVDNQRLSKLVESLTSECEVLRSKNLDFESRLANLEAVVLLADPLVYTVYTEEEC